MNKKTAEELRQEIYKKLPDLEMARFKLKIIYDDLERKIRYSKDDEFRRVCIHKAFKIKKQLEVLERAINLIIWHV